MQQSSARETHCLWLAVFSAAIFLSSFTVARTQGEEQLTSDLAGPPPVRCLAFSPDGQALAAAGANQLLQGELAIWNTDTWQVQMHYSEPVGFPNLAYSPSGHELALCRFAPELKVLDPQTGDVLRQSPPHGDHVRSVCYSRDGSRIITGSYDTTIVVWNAASFERVAVLSGHSSPVYSVDVTPDGKTLITADATANTAHQWDLTSNRLTRTFDDFGSLVPHACFSPDGQSIAVSTWNGFARIFDTTTGELRRELRDVAGVFWTTFSPDGKWLAAATYDSRVYVFDVRTDLDNSTNAALDRLMKQSDDEAFSAREEASQELSGVGYPAAVRLRVAQQSSSPEVRWRARRLLGRLDSGRYAIKLAGHECRLECVCFSPDSQLLASGDREGNIKIWRVADWKELRSLELPWQKSQTADD